MLPTYVRLLRCSRAAMLVVCAAIVALLSHSIGGCGPANAQATAAGEQLPAPLVRVLIERDVTSIKLAATSPPILESGSETGSGPVRLNLPDVPVELSLTAAEWRLGDKRFPRGELVLAQTVDGTLTVNDTAYRGRLRLVPQGRTAFDVVNDLDVESYLAGVLPKELPSHWNAATHQAQAVVARTYALYELKTAGASRGHFDVYDTDASQVYGGRTAETKKSRDAVEATRGQVVVQETDQGPRIFKAYFHSTSGGATIGNDEAFAEPPVGPLAASVTGDYGSASTRHQWEPFAVGKEELARRFVLWGERRGHPLRRLERLDRLEVVAKSSAGRPTRFEIIDGRQNHYSVTPEELRWAVNFDRGEGRELFSAWFTPINNATNIVFADGRGWGHGVGMCQWSAEGMAAAGRDYIDIVTTSYPGSRVVRAY